MFYKNNMTVHEPTVKLFIQSLDLALGLDYADGVVIARLLRTIHSDACKRPRGE